MIWYLVTIRDALALITRAGTYSTRASTHTHTYTLARPTPSPIPHTYAHISTYTYTRALAGAHINPDSRVTGMCVSSSPPLHKCLPAYNRPARIRVFRMNTLSRRFPRRTRPRRPAIRSLARRRFIRMRCLNSNSKIAPLGFERERPSPFPLPTCRVPEP